MNNSCSKLRKNKRLQRYNLPGHAHEIAFSCFHRCDYLRDSVACEFFIKELKLAKTKYEFRIWAYILMPNHVHLLIWPFSVSYNIAKILKSVKGRTSRSYSKYLLETNPTIHEKYLVKLGTITTFMFWQRVEDSIETCGMPKRFIVQFTILKIIQSGQVWLLKLLNGDGQVHGYENIKIL